MNGTAGLLACMLTACGQPSSPSTSTKSIRVTTVRYQRVYAAGASTMTPPMWIQMSIPVAGEQSGRSTIPICFPQEAAEGSFVCDGLNWDVPIDDDAWVNVKDPVVGRMVATTVFVNGQRVTRIRLNGAEETGDFRFDGAGTLR